MSKQNQKCVGLLGGYFEASPVSLRASLGVLLALLGLGWHACALEEFESGAPLCRRQPSCEAKVHADDWELGGVGDERCGEGGLSGGIRGLLLTQEAHQVRGRKPLAEDAYIVLIAQARADERRQ